MARNRSGLEILRTYRKGPETQGTEVEGDRSRGGLKKQGTLDWSRGRVESQEDEVEGRWNHRRTESQRAGVVVDPKSSVYDNHLEAQSLSRFK